MGLQDRKAQIAFGIGLLLLTTLAATMRFYWLDQIPAALHSDEAYEGLDAYRLLSIPIWEWPLFFTGINGREPLFVYLLALSQMSLGPSSVSLRIVPATIGVLFTPAMAWLAWELAPSLHVQRRTRLALWAGLAVLGLLWSQMFSRIVIRNGLFLLMEILFWAGLWRAWRSEDAKMREGEEVRNQIVASPLLRLLTSSLPRIGLAWWVLAGLWAGLGFYTYLPVRLWPVGLLPVATLALLRHRSALRQRGPGLVVALATATLVATPLAVYFARHPEHFTMRASQVSMLDRGDISAMLDNLVAVLGMAFWTGDGNVRVNLPDRPVLDLFMAVPFGVGLLSLLRRPWQPASFFLLANLGTMLLPTLLSEDPPNFGRAIGALPVFVLLVVLGLDRLARWGERLLSLPTGAFTAAGWGLLLVSAAVTWRAYFVEWAARPDLFAWWDGGYTELARHIAVTPAHVAGPTGAGLPRIYISPRGAYHPTVQYRLLGQPDELQPRGVDGRICVRVATDRPAYYYFLSNEDFRGPSLLQSYLPDSHVEMAVRDPAGNVWASVLVQPPGGSVIFPEMIPLSVQISGDIALLGYWTTMPQLYPGERLYLRLFWQVDATPGQSYTTFAHLIRLDNAGVATLLAGMDALPGNGSCPTTDWLPGEVVVDELQFVLSDDLPPSPGFAYYLEVGFYTLADGRRLDIPDNAEDRILLGPFSPVDKSS